MHGTGLFVLSMIAAGAVTSVAAGPATTPAGGTVARHDAAVRPAVARVTGMATYYAAEYQGQIMANGRPFEMWDDTIAASNDWPLGTRLQVRRAEGGPWDASLSDAERAHYFGRVVAVTVEDRGTFTHRLDLSLAAFAELGRPDEGVIHVDIEPLDNVAQSFAQARTVSAAR